MLVETPDTVAIFGGGKTATGAWNAEKLFVT